MLVDYDVNRPIKLYCDASARGVSACLMHVVNFVWWPGLDNAIEKLTNDCEPCKVTAVMPAAVARHPWLHPSAPWERAHIDYGEWNNHHFQGRS